MLGTLECPCGGCLPCRINRRRVWAHRILLESFKHGDNCFVTLTYDDAHVPEFLNKEDYQCWLKRLRKSVFPRKIRYFLVGEYGELSGRPHFHAVIFGLDWFTAGGVDGRCGVVKSVWPFGFTFVGQLTWASAQYVAGYLTKKVVSDENSVREFSRMSLRPGIGAHAMADLARALSNDAGLDYVAVNSDVPSVLRHGKKLLPLGRYLRRCLRGELGFVSKDTPVAAARLCALRSAAAKLEARAAIVGKKTWEVDKIMLDTRMQKLHNSVVRFQIHDSVRKL